MEIALEDACRRGGIRAALDGDGTLNLRVAIPSHREGIGAVLDYISIAIHLGPGSLPLPMMKRGLSGVLVYVGGEEADQ
ncbi:MAG: hypothetical protein WDN28_25185 [Chthoniobacter sp.]